MVMDGYYYDRLPQLRKEINNLHMSYLEMEETPEKMENRNKLETCIKEYLNYTPHLKKFCFTQTAEVLRKSANNSEDFSGYKAALGWNAIGIYASNLLTQSWRREYRQIKMYSGYYKHQIDANLDGAEVIFEIMGYKQVGNGILMLEEPICPDRVTNVSHDALVAYVECQILKEVWEEVYKTYDVTWLDVLKFREAHLCSPKQTAQGLTYLYHHSQHQKESCSQPMGVDMLQNRNMDYHPALPTTYSYPPSDHNSHYNNSQYMYGNHNNYSPYNMFGHVSYGPQIAHYPQRSVQPTYCYNGYNNDSQLRPSYVVSVPTAQLIEVEPTLTKYNELNSDNDLADVTAASHNTYKTNITAPTEFRVRDNTVADREEGSGTFEGWDYVYKNLESQGYTKDLGERGNILSVKKNATIIDSEIQVDGNGLTVTERPLKVSLNKTKKNDTLRESYYNTGTVKDVKKQNNKNKMHSTSNDKTHLKFEPGTIIAESLDGKKVNQESSNHCAVLKSTDSKVQKVDSSSSKLPVSHHYDTMPERRRHEVFYSKDEDIKSTNVLQTSTTYVKWQCPFCTFINDPANNICDMCNKSKNLENTNSMEVGGSECSACTLVNPKGVRVCQACDVSLQNSPTYI